MYAYGDPIAFNDPWGLRPPSGVEEQFIKTYFGNCLDPKKLNIKVRRWGDTRRALSLGGGFTSFPSSDFIDGSGDNDLNLSDPDIAGIVGNEFLRQLQRPMGVNVTGQALALQSKYSLHISDPYSYNWSADPSVMLQEFLNGNVEQQGQMFQDYLTILLRGHDTTPYNQIAKAVKDKCGCAK